MWLSHFLTAIVAAAEKGSDISKIIRSDSTLLSLLIQEKKGTEKNERFVQDFKTFADVLIQEMVRHDLSVQFTGIGDNVYGEESSDFTNTAGTSLTVHICPTQEETADLLKSILGGNVDAAGTLSKALHNNAVMSQRSDLHLDVDLELSVENTGVWIDPIDSTAQYIRGEIGSADGAGIVEEGVQCVTVLIGAFDKQTGQSIAGVCVQPFAELNSSTKQWTSKTTWGVNYKHIKVYSPNIDASFTRRHTIALSGSETDSVRRKLGEKFRLVTAAGAGYKILCCVWGAVDAYVLSKPTIYKWDCCAPHAVLLSLAGGITLYSNTQGQDGGKSEQLRYNFSGAETNHSFNGIIAYRTEEILLEIQKCLDKSS